MLWEMVFWEVDKIRLAFLSQCVFDVSRHYDKKEKMLSKNRDSKKMRVLICAWFRRLILRLSLIHKEVKKSNYKQADITGSRRV